MDEKEEYFDFEIEQGMLHGLTYEEALKEANIHWERYAERNNIPA